MSWSVARRLANKISVRSTEHADWLENTGCGTKWIFYWVGPHIETKYENSSTIKSKLCGIYKFYKVLNIKSDLFKNKIEEYKYKTETQRYKEKDSNKKDEDGGNKLIEEFKNIMKN